MLCIQKVFPGFRIQITNSGSRSTTLFCFKIKKCCSTFVYLNIFNGQMFKYAQILGSVLRSFDNGTGVWNRSKKDEWNDSLKNLVYSYWQYVWSKKWLNGTIFILIWIPKENCLSYPLVWILFYFYKKYYIFLLLLFRVRNFYF